MSQRPSATADAAIIFVGALVVRAAFCFAVYPLMASQFGAGDGYDEIALNLATGHGYTLDGVSAAAERLPLYPLLLATAFRIFGPAAWPWELAQCVCGALTCVVVLVIARRFASRAAALAAAALCSVHPTLILYTARPLTETVYIFLLVLLVWALSVPRRTAVAGVLLGLQWLVKSTAVIEIVAFLPTARRQGIAAVARAAGGAMLMLLPWVGWSVVTTGQAHLFTATSGRALYHGLYISQHVGWVTPAGDLNRDAEMALWDDLAAAGVARDADVVQRDAIAGHVARQWIVAHAGETLRLGARNVVLTWYLGRSRLSMLIHVVLHGVLLLAAAVGARRLWRSTSTARELVFIAVSLIVAYTVFHAALQPAVRYILPAVPLVAVLAAGAQPRANREDAVR